MLSTLLSSFGFDYTYTTTTTTSSGSVSAGTLIGIIVVALLVTLVLFIIPMWKIYRKAGRPGWAAIIPIYNSVVLFEIVGYPGWWAVLLLIPIVNLFPAIMSLVAYFKLAKLFGKSDLFGVMTILFSFICLPILGYGSATFRGSKDSSQAVTPTSEPPADDWQLPQ